MRFWRVKWILGNFQNQFLIQLFKVTRLFVGIYFAIFSSLCASAIAQESGYVRPSLIGECKISLSQVLPWECKVVAMPNDTSGFRPECKDAKSFSRDPVFATIKNAKSASKALENLVNHKLEVDGFLSTIDWFACQKIFVLVSADASSEHPNASNTVTKMQIGFSFFVNPDLSAEVEKWNDLLIQDKFLFFTFYSAPARIEITTLFSARGEIVDISVSSSDK